jgi:hypothetical protein
MDYATPPTISHLSKRKNLSKGKLTPNGTSSQNAQTTMTETFFEVPTACHSQPEEQRSSLLSSLLSCRCRALSRGNGACQVCTLCTRNHRKALRRYMGLFCPAHSARIHSCRTQGCVRSPRNATWNHRSLRTRNLRSKEQYMKMYPFFLSQGSRVAACRT